MIIAAKIDVKKLDKARFFAGKNGALYCDIILLENRSGADQFGNNFSIKQSQTKEEREAGQEMPFIGNAKIIGGNAPAKAARPPRQESSSAPAQDDW